MPEINDKSDHPIQPELRRDPITSEWVVLAAGRGKRPHAPKPVEAADQPDDQCPFCPGKEPSTPPEICAFREGEGCDSPGWTVRTFPNKFPLLVSEVSGQERASSPDRKPAVGSSEVIVDTTVHNKPPWLVGAAQTLDMLNMYRDRIVSIAQEGRERYVHIIRNHKAGAASSLEHPHSQLYGLPFVPPMVDTELDGFAQTVREGVNCVLCDVLEKEIAAGERIVEVTENFVVFCPYASRLPYETWIVPRHHEMRFERCEHLPEMAEVMTRVMRSFWAKLSDPPFNYWIHTYPLRGEIRPFHWHLEILPRMTVPGGLELGAGVWVNVVAPEEAAGVLREP
jgi:UDPglucose--hexose-1-phosphate uridylyltransferase